MEFQKIYPSILKIQIFFRFHSDNCNVKKYSLKPDFNKKCTKK